MLVAARRYGGNPRDAVGPGNAKRVLIDALKFLKDQKPDIDMKSKNVHYLLMMSRVFLEEDMQTLDWRFKENIDAK